MLWVVAGSVAGRQVVAALAGLALVAACTFRGPPDNLLVQRATWFSYLDGADLRAACMAGAPDRYRFVYNADFSRQARGYEVIPDAEGGAVMQQMVHRGLTVDRVNLFDPLSIGAPPLAESRLSAADLAALKQAMSDSEVFDPPPVGLRLNSAEVYWVVSGCRAGHFFLTAYRQSTPRFNTINFAEILRRHDATGVPYREPADVDADHPGTQTCYDDEAEAYICFNIEIGTNGLVGIATID